MFMADFTDNIKASSSGEETSRVADAKWVGGLDEECPFVAVGFNLQPLDTQVRMLKKEEDLGSERVIDPVLGWDSEEATRDIECGLFDEAYKFATSMVGEFQLNGELDWSNPVRFVMGFANDWRSIGDGNLCWCA